MPKDLDTKGQQSSSYKGTNESTPREPDAQEIKEREGLQMNFRINNYHLISHTLASMDESRFSSSEHKEDIVAFQNYAWGESERYYDFIAGRVRPEQFFATGGTLKEIGGFLSKIEQSNEFGKIRQQTEVYLAKVKAEWKKNYPQTSQAIQEITGLDLNKDITVNVTHPSLRNGAYLGNNIIGWGHTPEWNNYNTVYLWHEVLHSYLDYTDLSHTLIQLITDNELRIRLNQRESYPPFVGHDNLFPLMARALPLWQSYLGEAPVEGKRDILRFEEKLKVMPEFQEKLGDRNLTTKIID